MYSSYNVTGHPEREKEGEGKNGEKGQRGVKDCGKGQGLSMSVMSEDDTICKLNEVSIPVTVSLIIN